MNRLLLTTLLLFACSTGSRAVTAEEPPSAASFARLPPIGDISLSRDGTKAVVLRALEGTYHATIMDMRSGESKLLMASDPDEFAFNWCRFANDTRIVCSIRAPITLTTGDITAGARWYPDGRTIATRLLAVDIDGSDPLQLVPSAITEPREDLKWNDPQQDDVISWIRGDPAHILMQLSREDRTQPTVYRLNIYNNRLHRVRRYHSSIESWIADEEGNIRLAVDFRREGGVNVYHVDGRKLEKLDFEPLIGERNPIHLGFAADNSSIWVSTNNGRDTQGIYRISLPGGNVLETLAEDSQHDISQLLTHPKTKKPIRSNYWTDTLTTRWYDTEWQSTFAELERTLPGNPTRVYVTTLDESGNRMILHTEGNGTHPAMYLFDRAATTLIPLAQWYTDIGPVATPRTVTFKARDGLNIPAYLTLPAGNKPGPHPTILLPHGGPWARDTSRYDYWVQMLASRGYVVLQPNFRGSSGYGDRYLQAGFEQWGLKMQDDLMDGLAWVIEQGHTDPERVCIVGGSYGGYAALVASFKAPELFRCAVSFAGVSSLADLSDRLWRFRLGGLTAARIQSGDLRRENSPLEQVAKVGVPLLLVHGELDRVVPVEQSRDMAAALEKAGKTYRYIEQEGGDHHLSLEKHRAEFLEALDGFLRQHLR